LHFQCKPSGNTLAFVFFAGEDQEDQDQENNENAVATAIEAAHKLTSFIVGLVYHMACIN